MIEVLLLFLAALVLLAWLLRALAPLCRKKKPLAVLDGSNVMYWQDSKPQLATVQGVLRLLQREGYETGVIFDANAGWLLAGKYLNDRAFAQFLGLKPDSVLVVPKGEQADPFLLNFATKSDALIISNDRFRDRIADYPALTGPGRLVRGGWRNGAPWLDLPGAERGQ